MGAEFLGDLKEDFSHEFSSTLVWKPDLSRLARRRTSPPLNEALRGGGQIRHPNEVSRGQSDNFAI